MSNSRETRTAVSLFLLSIGIIAHQISLMQILSNIQWYHFAYMIVALALLGFGAAGTFFALFRERFLAESQTIVPKLMLGCGISIALALSPAYLKILRFDLYLLFVDASQIFRLTGACLLFCLPFFFGGLAIALALTSGVKRTGFLYFANLTGSGCGGLIGLWLINHFHPMALPPLVALFPIGAGLILLKWRNIGRALLSSIMPVGICILLFMLSPNIEPSQFKDISRLMRLPDAEEIVRKPGAHGLLQVVNAPALRQAPGLSFNYHGPIPNNAAILINGDAYGSLSMTAPQKVPLLDFSTEALGYLFNRQPSVLLLQPGGSGPIDLAIAGNATNILALEQHPGIIRLLQTGIKGFTGYSQYPQVKLLQTDPRGFLAEHTGAFDIIRFPTVGAFDGNIGLYALSEQFLLTRQSFELARQRLSPEGVLMVNVWIDYPVKNPLKLLATLIETCERAGVVTPRQHIVAIRSWGAITFVLKKTPVTVQQNNAIRKLCDELGFDPLLLPDIRNDERDRFHKLQDQDFFKHIDMLFTSERQQLYREYEFNIVPATDYRPYFSQFLNFTRLGSLIVYFNLRQLPFFEMGSFILIITLIILIALATLLIILPLFQLGRLGFEHVRTFILFGSLGLGYMMLEIVFIQNFTLLLGHPLLAAATVLTSLLFFSGLGSLYSEKISSSPLSIRTATGLTGLFIIIYTILLMYIVHLQGSPPIELRVLLSIFLLAPISFTLGMPFPLSLRLLNENRPSHIPWAWGINGCFSVIGPALATIIAVNFGFQFVFALAAAAYFLVFFILTY